MKIAVMQPYLFPYLGYFQMIAAATVFVSYDTVDFIQRGWIHRNRILINGRPKYFTATLKKSPLGTPINEILLADYPAWSQRFMTTLTMAYKKTPYFEQMLEVVDAVIKDKQYSKVSELSFESVRTISEYFALKTQYKQASSLLLKPCSNREKRLEMIVDQLDGDQIILPREAPRCTPTGVLLLKSIPWLCHKYLILRIRPPSNLIYPLSMFWHEFLRP